MTLEQLINMLLLIAGIALPVVFIAGMIIVVTARMENDIDNKGDSNVKL